MMKITGLSHLFKWENLHNWWLTKYFFAPLYMFFIQSPKNMHITIFIYTRPKKFIYLLLLDLHYFSWLV